MKLSVLFAAALAAAALVSPPQAGAAKTPEVCAACIKANLEKLAGDELRGRACGTEDENAAARFIADTLKSYHVSPALAEGAYLRPVRLETPTRAKAPVISLTAGGQTLTLTSGREILATGVPEALKAETILVTDAAAVSEAVQGKAVIYDPPAYNPGGVAQLVKAGAALVITVTPARYLEHWGELADQPPGPIVVEGVPPGPPPPRFDPVVLVKPDVMAPLRAMAGGQLVLDAPLGPAQVRTTYNVFGVLHGKAPDADRHAVLLSAHYDHLGVRNGVIFHGANDDASGTTAVLEFARILGAGARHGRTVYFALFGCEERGELGAKAFMANPPLALSDLALNLEFEMIGVDDPKRPGALMLTGWDRTNLGPALAAHGAKVGPDLYPEQHFFNRSDNYQLALKGVVAQTVSAWPLPPTYHQASDDLAHVDTAFMASVIASMVGPITWLLDGDFQPDWLPGQKP